MIRSIADIQRYKNVNRFACLDSGGLDSAYLLCKLFELKKTNIETLTLRFGQEDICPITLPQDVEKNIKRNYVDATEVFCQNFVLPLLFAGGMYTSQHPLSASLSRPLIASKLVELAKKKNIDIILHAATPGQNSMRRFNGAIRDLGFKGLYGSPYEQDYISREEKAKYVEKMGGKVSSMRSFSIDSNLFCREFESGNLKNPEKINPPPEMFLWTQLKYTEPRNICISFKNGIPTHIDGKEFSLSDIIKELNKSIGAYGLGQFRGLEENPYDEKVLEIREAPAAFILIQGLNYLANASHSLSSLIAKSQLDQLWMREASEGRWFGHLKESIDSFNQTFMQIVSGDVSFELLPYRLNCTGVKATNPRYATDRDQSEFRHSSPLPEAA